LKVAPNNGLVLPLYYHRPDVILILGSHETFESYPSLVVLKDREIIRQKSRNKSKNNRNKIKIKKRKIDYHRNTITENI
jgi:hypothetical protein